MKAKQQNIHRIAVRPGQQAAGQSSDLRGIDGSLHTVHRKTGNGDREETTAVVNIAKLNDVPSLKPNIPGRLDAEIASRKSKSDSLLKIGDQLNIGTWNVCSIRQDGDVELLIYQLKRLKWSIVGISETRWNGIGIKTVDDIDIIYSGTKRGHLSGVGLILSSEAQKALIDYTPVSDRILSATFNSHPFPLKVIQAYAPTSTSTEEEVDDFYAKLEDEYNASRKKHITIIIGDFNAKVGSQHQPPTTGKHGYGDINDRGVKLKDFCAINNLAIANTFFKHKPNRKFTWRHPDGVHRNMIDFTLVPQRWKNCVRNCRSFPSADYDTDHQLQITTFKLKLKKTANRRPRGENNVFDYDMLDAKLKTEFELKLSNRFAALGNLGEWSNGGLDKMTDEFNDAIIETSKELLPRKQVKKQPWISRRTLELTDIKRTVKKSTPEYRKLRSDIKSSIKKDQDNWTDQIATEAERAANMNNTRSLHKLPKATQNAFRTKQKTTSIKNEAGFILTQPQAVLERWEEYSRKLYNYDIKADEESLSQLWNNQEQDEQPDISLEEVRAAIRRLKDRKSPGSDYITAEMLKLGGEEVTNRIHAICKNAWSKEHFPTQWTKSVIITIHKKGDINTCSNYRTISLISHSSKILLEIIRQRLKPHIEKHLPETQAGFRASRGTIDQIFALKCIVEKYMELKDNSVYNIFIDYKKAFDRVWHRGLFSVLSHYNIPRKLVSLIKDLYFQATSAVRIGRDISEWFSQTVGVRQGCLLSPDLFNIFIEHILNQALADEEGILEVPKLNGVRISNLQFADDIALMNTNREHAQKRLEVVDKHSTKMGMEINTEKTKLLITRPKNVTPEPAPDIMLGTEVIKQVDHFKYLGYNLTSDNNTMYDLKIKTATALTSMAKLDRIWTNKNFSLKNKLRLLNCLIFPIAFYASDAWTLSNTVKHRIDTFQLKCYRKILNIKWQDHITNDEIWRLVGGGTPLSRLITKKQLKWFGHVCRMSSERLPKTILQGKVEGQRRRGRPTTRWDQALLVDPAISFQEAVHLAQDRTRWRELCDRCGAGGYVSTRDTP